MFDIPAGLREALVGSMNASIAKRTWAAYGSAYRSFVKTLLEYDITPPTTITTRHLLIFVGSLVVAGKASSTIKSYLSGVKKVAEAKAALLKSL